MTMGDQKCDCCGVHPPIGVASSALMAMSFAFCEECLRSHAEPEQVLVYLLWINLGDKEINRAVRDWLYTFKDGVYITWDQWFDKYGSKIDLNAEFGGPYMEGMDEDEIEIRGGDERSPELG